MDMALCFGPRYCLWSESQCDCALCISPLTHQQFKCQFTSKVDSMHSAIENACKHQKVYNTHKWAIPSCKTWESVPCRRPGISGLIPLPSIPESIMAVNVVIVALLIQIIHMNMCTRRHAMYHQSG